MMGPRARSKGCPPRDWQFKPFDKSIFRPVGGQNCPECPRCPAPAAGASAADAVEPSWPSCLNFYETDNTTSIIGASQQPETATTATVELAGRRTLSAFTAAAAWKDIRYCFSFRLFWQPYVCGARFFCGLACQCSYMAIVIIRTRLAAIFALFHTFCQFLSWFFSTLLLSDACNCI